MAIIASNVLKKLAERRNRQEESNFLKKYAELNSMRTILSSKELSKLYNHAVLNGRSKEIFLMDLLKPYIFPNIGMCTGTIFDRNGQQSDQIDIIIYDKSITPPVLLNEFEGAIPYESVLATIEVKSMLNITSLKESIKFAWSIKTLTFSQNTIIKKVSNDPNDYVHSPICCIFAYDSSIAIQSPEKELQRLITLVNEFNTKIEDEHINISKIQVPISLLCIAKSSNIEIININEPSNPDSWEITQIENGRPNNILKFISKLIDTCSQYALERETLLIETYIK